MQEEADIKLEGLSIWISGREFPQSSDFWDGNWLNCRVVMQAPGARVEFNGPYLRNEEIARFCAELEKAHQTSAGDAVLESIEPNLRISLKMNATGQVYGIVEVTPDIASQKHEFDIVLDQSYYPELISACAKVLERYPVRNAP